jgi:hypothetical protein
MKDKFKWTGPEGYKAQDPGTGDMKSMSKLTDAYGANDFAGYVKDWS